MLKHLTPAELEVLAAAERGETGPELARRTGRSYWTIKDHLKRIRRKLGARTIAHAVAIAAAERAQAGDGPSTAQQKACFHARCDALDLKVCHIPGVSKTRALLAVNEEFGIKAESVKDLSYSQLSYAIDVVTDELRSVTA